MSAIDLVPTARGVAWHVLERVERDRAFADLVLHAALATARLERRDRAFATELAYGTLRLRGRLDAALGQGLDRPLRRVEPALLNLLRLGAYQLLCLSGVPDPAVVDESVSLARKVGLERATGFTNAVLRGLARKRDEKAIAYPDFAADPVGHVETWGSLPRWLAERLVAELGAEEARAFALACAEPPPRSVRVCAGFDRLAVAQALGGRPTRYAPSGVTAAALDPVRAEGFDRGEYVVQDEASQLVPLLLGAESGETVVDCCAAPGTKAVQLAEQVGPRGEVIALELHRSRLALIHNAARRLRLLNLRPLERDVARGFDLQGRASYKRILVDAPCTGLGTLRRNPDARWRLRPEDVPRAAESALSILSSAARYVEEGGVLVYSVCTFTPEETTGVLSHFLESHPDFRVDDPRPLLPEPARELAADGRALATWPQRHGCDGFFAVRLVRK
ncbi:MAG TPA: 16S rRNA (cytosine(967)-C(5))-methyltransferase RsmB [Myxococcota bacterium]|nr:16S rRNA (cytosine(967)-C(5))-methyltransferase RsmB [Myxococcota bacterium]